MDTVLQRREFYDLILLRTRSSTDRVTDFESEGCRFESYRVHFKRTIYLCVIFLFVECIVINNCGA